MRYFQIGCAVLALALVTPSARAGQLLSNGGFETGNFSGWTQGGNLAFTTVWSGAGVAHSGNSAAALGPVGSVGTLSQTFSTTAGQTLYLSYWLGSDGQQPNSFGVTLGSGLSLQQTNLPAQPYKFYSFSTTATGPTTTLSFSFNNDPGFLRLDDVSVTTSPNDPRNWPSGGTTPAGTPGASTANAPEPASLALLGLGAAGLLCGLRRRRSA
jgi:hypothetical protein